MYYYICIMPFSCYFCREGRKVCWPFQDNFSRGIDPFSKSSDLSTLVEQILVVFQNCSADPLLEKWTKRSPCMSVGLNTCTLQLFSTIYHTNRLLSAVLC